MAAAIAKPLPIDAISAPAKAAPHPRGPIGSPLPRSASKHNTATEVPSAKCAMLNENLSGPCLRCKANAMLAPSNCATTSSQGAEKKKPTTSGTSLRENECASRRN